jgi:hypothetical protein
VSLNLKDAKALLLAAVTAPTLTSAFVLRVTDAATGLAYKATLAAINAVLDHTALQNIGTNTHAQIDTFLAGHKASHQNGGGDEISVAGLSGQLADAQPVTVRKNGGADVGTRARLNLIEGSGVTLTVADDAGDGEVDVTIAAAAGGVSDGDKGDITVSGSGAAWAIDAGVVTLAKQADMAADSIQGRANGAGTGVPQALTATQVRTILNVENGAAADQSAAEVPFTPAGDIAATDVQAAIVEVRDDTDTKLATKAASSHTHAVGDVAGVTTDRLIGRDTAATGVAEELTVGGGVEFTGSGGIQRSALTGDVTASAGSGSTTIANAAVTLAKMADLAQSRIIGRAAAAGTGVPTALTPTEVWTLLGALVADLDAGGFDILNLGRAALNLESISSASNVLTLNFATANDKVCTLTENVTTVSTSNEPASGKSQIIKLLIIGASTYTLPASWADVDWWISDSGSAPSAPAAGKRLLVTLWALNVGGTVHVIGNAAEQP